jgi:FlaA1/EpsC-like NDP-sugar epimerase
MSLKDQKELPITDERMTRFMISLDQGVNLVWHSFEDMMGGEIYVKKIPSIKVVDIAKVIAPEAKHKIIGIRPGEKIHEQMIGSDDSNSTFEYLDYYKILPQINEWEKDNLRIKNGKKVPDGFSYISNANQDWMTKSELKKWIDKNQNYIQNN